MSWQDLDQIPRPKEVDIEPSIQFWSLSYAVFEANPLGKELFDILWRQIELPVCPPGCKDTWGPYREGQNDILRQIKDAIQKHKNQMKETK